MTSHPVDDEVAMTTMTSHPHDDNDDEDDDDPGRAPKCYNVIMMANVVDDVMKG